MSVGLCFDLMDIFLVGTASIFSIFPISMPKHINPFSVSVQTDPVG